jgi:hypothetical protein
LRMAFLSLQILASLTRIAVSSRCWPRNGIQGGSHPGPRRPPDLPGPIFLASSGRRSGAGQRRRHSLWSGEWHWKGGETVNGGGGWTVESLELQGWPVVLERRGTWKLKVGPSALLHVPPPFLPPSPPRFVQHLLDCAPATSLWFQPENGRHSLALSNDTYSTPTIASKSLKFGCQHDSAQSRAAMRARAYQAHGTGCSL